MPIPIGNGTYVWVKTRIYLRFLCVKGVETSRFTAVHLLGGQGLIMYCQCVLPHTYVLSTRLNAKLLAHRRPKPLPPCHEVLLDTAG